MTEQLGLRGHRIQNPARMKARRREILVAAAQVFARDGYSYATLDDVAAQMGVSRGVIYYYSRSKEETLVEILATASGEAVKRLEAIIARGDPPDATLLAALRDLAAHLFNDIPRFATLVRGSGRLGDPSWLKTLPIRQRNRALIRGIIESGIRAGVFVDLDPGLMTINVLQTVLRIAEWYQPEGRLPPEVIVEQMIELAMRSVRRC